MRHTATLRSAESITITRLALAQALERRKGRVLQDDAGSLSAKLGSRLGFWFWGAWGPYPTYRLPLTVRLSFVPESGQTVVRLQAETDEGWNTSYPAYWTAFVRQAFNELENDLAAALADQQLDGVVG